jgi:ribosomal protein L29
MAEKQRVKALTELRTLDEAALVKKVAELKKELVEAHRGNAAGELPNPRAIGKLRKQIAQAFTLLTAKRREAKAAKFAKAKEEEK